MLMMLLMKLRIEMMMINDKADFNDVGHGGDDKDDYGDDDCHDVTMLLTLFT